MKCNEVMERLSVCAEKELSMGEQAQLREHIAGCEECRRQEEFLQAFQARLRESLREEVECPDFVSAVDQFLPQRRRARPWRLVFAFAGSACFAALLLFFALSRPAQQHRPTNVANRPMPVKAPKREQVVNNRQSPSITHKALRRKDRVAVKRMTPGERVQSFRNQVAANPGKSRFFLVPRQNDIASGRSSQRRGTHRELREERIASRNPALVSAERVQQAPASQVARGRRPVALIMVTWKAPESQEQSYGYTRYDSNNKPIEEQRVKKSGDSVEIFWEKTPEGTKQKSGGEGIEKPNRA